MQHARNVMIVVTHAKTSPDQLAYHRPRPDSALIPRGHRTRFDQGHQGLMLRVRQARLPARPLPRAQTLRSRGFEPLQPAVDRATRDIELRRQVDNTDTSEVTPHRCRAAPASQIPDPFRFIQKLAQFAQFLSARSGRTARFAVLRSRHALVLQYPNQPTMILQRSSVNTLDPYRGDHV